MNNTTEIITGWLMELCGGENSFEYRDDGVYTFNLENDIEVSIVIPLDQEVVSLHAPVSGIPEEDADRLELYSQALQMNLLNARTRGASLAINKRISRLVLGYSTPVEGMDLVGFSNLVSSFIETVKSVRDELRSAPASVQVESPATRSEDSQWMKA